MSLHVIFRNSHFQPWDIPATNKQKKHTVNFTHFHWPEILFTKSYALTDPMVSPHKVWLRRHSEIVRRKKIPKDPTPSPNTYQTIHTATVLTHTHTKSTMKYIRDRIRVTKVTC